MKKKSYYLKLERRWECKPWQVLALEPPWERETELDSYSLIECGSKWERKRSFELLEEERERVKTVKYHREW